jgi:hypothetical protein
MTPLKLISLFSHIQNEQIAMDVLKNLKEFPMTLELLQKSGIGLATNKLRKKFENTELSSFAKKLIKSWKKLVPGACVGCNLHVLACTSLYDH